MDGLAKLSFCTCLGFLLWTGGALALSLSTGDQAFLISGSKAVGHETLGRHRRSITSSITSMNVTSVIMSRFARVTYSSRMENELDEDKEMTFSVILPDAAFITEFNMIVNGVTFVGKVKAKEIAQKQYQQAVESGNSAGLVKADVRKSQTFDVSANVPAHSGVDFHLVCQQLLERKHGLYDHAILLDLREVVADLSITVYITEKTGITDLEATGPKIEPVRTEDGFEIRSVAGEIRRSKRQAKITFRPSATEQRLLLQLPEKQRKFSVKYDVTREVLGGEIQTRNGYFVHFFAPETLAVLPKKVVFVIDKSGSMSGRKMEQTKSAFESVLRELRDTDQFNVVTFSNNVERWKEEIVYATEETVDGAVAYVRGINAGGGTNFYDGVLSGAALLDGVRMHDTVSSMVIVLTDGHPTSGQTNKERIRLDVRNKVQGRFSLFCLGFGQHLSHDFLSKLAHENDGISRQIYEDSDANLQLESFFQEVATPLMLNVRLRYPNENVHDVTPVDFDKYFGGSEVIVVGAYDSSENSMLRSVVSGQSLDGPVDFDVTGSEIDDSFQHWFEDTGDFDDFIERMWAYRTIRLELEKKSLLDSRVQIEEINDKVMRLALKYNFVTPLTSMVVTLPEDEVTTAPTGTTKLPPLPPCYHRGDNIPEHAVGRHIWCPIVLGERQRKRQRFYSDTRVAAKQVPAMASVPMAGYPSNRYAAGPPLSRYRMQSISQGRTSGRRRMYSSSRMMMMMPTSYGRISHPHYESSVMDEYWPSRTPPPKPQRWDGCSDNLDSLSGTIRIPDGAPEHGRAFICEFDINLPDGSWIDLTVEHLSTTKNKVKITDNKSNLLDHRGGESSPRYIAVQSNNIHVRMEIDPSDTQRPGIVITYQQFVPSIQRSSTAPANAPIDVFIEPNPSCGETFVSSTRIKGNVSSPAFPASYPHNALCVWTFENHDPSRYKLRIKFIDMDIETDGEDHCPHDKVVLLDGTEEHTFCGFKTPHKILSSERIVKMAFVSDGSLEASGFLAHYRFLKLD